MDYDKKSFERHLLSVMPRNIVVGLRKANVYHLVLEYLFEKQNNNPSVYIDFSRPVFNQDSIVKIWADEKGVISEVECNGICYK